MSATDDLIDSIRDANDITKLITGKSLIDLVGDIAELCGWDVARKVLEEEIPIPDSPYAILGVRQSASMAVIRLTYRNLIKKKMEPEEFDKIHEAYLKIMSMRGEG